MTREAINFSWLVRLRFWAIAAQIVTIFAARHLFELELPLSVLLSVIAVELATNVACMAAVRRGAVVAEWWSGAVMVLDVFLLTTLLHFTGGPFNPFSFLYLVEIALAAVILHARWTWTLVLVSLVGSGVLFVLQRNVLVTHPHHMQLHLRGMWVAFGVAATFIVYFLLRVRGDLEARERELSEAERRADRQERLASLATLAAGAAHELSTPLSTIALAARELERDLGRLLAERSADLSPLEDVQLIRSQVDRCRAILDRMALDAGQTRGEAAEPVQIADLLLRAVDGLPVFPPIALDLARAEGCVLYVPPRAIAQAVRSLVKNAQEATHSDAAVVLRAEQQDAVVAIEVQDRGCGMAASELSRAGEPFFTTKEPGRGMGLGLFLTRTLVERLGGELRLSSEAGGGTRALVLLPGPPPAKTDRMGSGPAV